MAVDNVWFWTLLLVGATMVGAAIVLYLRGRPRPRDVPLAIGDHEVLMYVNETLAIEILQYRGDVPALKRQVEQYTRESAEGRGETRVRWFNFSAGRLRDRGTTEFYEAEELPVNAIRRVVRALEEADAIVYVDMYRGEVHAHKTLPASPTGTMRLSDCRRFLSISGLFEEYEEGDGSDEEYVRLRTPYPSNDAYIRVKIMRRGLRDKDVLPEGKAPFAARVLGKVENWSEDDRLLKMWALAIFR